LDAVNLCIRDLERREQKLSGSAKVAFRIGRRHTTLVGPEKLNRTQSSPNASNQFRHRGKELSGNPTARQRCAVRRSAAASGFDFLKPFCRDSVCKFAVAGETGQFNMVHGFSQWFDSNPVCGDFSIHIT
jgi:hypothetical protein